MAEKVVKIVFEIDGVEKVVNSIEEYEKEVKKAGEATEKAGEKQGFFAKRAEAVKETLGDLKASLGDLGKGYSMLQKGLTKVAGGFGLSAKASKVFGKAASAAIAATGIGLLVPLVLTLVNYFQNLEGGAKALKKIMAGLGAIVANVGKAFKLLISGDFSGAFDTLKDSVVEATSAVDDLFDAEQKLADLRKKTVIENAQLNQEIEKQRKILEDTTLGLDERLAALDKVNAATKQLQENQIAETEEALRAAEAQLTLTNNYEERREKELEIAELKATLIDQTTQLQNIEYDAARVGRELRQQALDEEKAAAEERKKIAEKEAEDKRIAEEEAAAKKLAEEEAAALAEQAEADRKAQLREIEQQLDLEDIENAYEKARQEMAIQEEQALAELELLGATEAQKQRVRDSFAKKKKKLDKDEAAFGEKMAEAEADAKMGLAADAFASIAQLAGENSAVGKAAAAAATAINTYQGASKALAELPPPFSYIAAATTVVAGLAQVKNIMSTKLPQGDGASGGARSSGISVSAPSAASVDPNAAIEAASQGQEINRQIGLDQDAQANQPVKAYVVSEEVSSSQEANKKINELATL